MKATYHTDSGQKEQRLDVLSKNPDGTVNLGNAGTPEGDVLVIGKCQVSKEPVIGQCVLDPEPVKETKDPEKPKK